MYMLIHWLSVCWLVTFDVSIRYWRLHELVSNTRHEMLKWTWSTVIRTMGYTHSCACVCVTCHRTYILVSCLCTCVSEWMRNREKQREQEFKGDRGGRERETFARRRRDRDWGRGREIDLHFGERWQHTPLLPLPKLCLPLRCHNPSAVS